MCLGDNFEIIRVIMDDSPDRGPYIVTVICAVTATGTVFALARLYARGVILGKLHADDYLIVASVVRRGPPPSPPFPPFSHPLYPPSSTGAHTNREKT